MSHYEALPKGLTHNIEPCPEAKIKPSSDGHPTYGEASHNPWPGGYRSLTQVLGPIEEIPFQGNPGLNHNPTVSHLGPITRPSIPVIVGGESSNQAMSVKSHIGEKPPAQVMSYVSGTMSSLGQVVAIAQPIVVIPTTNTNAFPPSSSTGQSIGPQPVKNTVSWVYTYPRTQQPMVNQV